MRAASDQQSSFAQPASLRRRAVSLALALAAEGLLLLMLLRLAPAGSPTAPRERSLITFSLADAGREEAAAQAKRAPRQRRSRSAAPQPAGAPPPPVLAPIVPPPPQATGPLNMLILSREDYAATDISRLPSHAGQAAGAAQQADAGEGDSEAAGTGPNGERLYNAEWYREPTHAELAGYLPRGAPRGAWAMIACQTVPRFHVDDCQELGDSPAGSGLARAMREAAWQFLVRPPRVGGKSLVGAWVRIRIDFTAAPDK